MSKVIERAEALYKEAKSLLYKKDVDEILSSAGEVLYAGSYAMNLMVWKDIDLNVVVDKEKRELAVKNLVTAFLDREDVSRIKIFRDLRKKHGKVMPDGIYLGLELDGWKFDIHVVNALEASETRAKTERIISKLSEETREIILELKCKYLTPEGKTPKCFSANLYEAILIQELREEKDILEYLREKGIAIS